MDAYDNSMQLDLAQEGGPINTGNPVLPNNFDPEVLLKCKSQYEPKGHNRGWVIFLLSFLVDWIIRAMDRLRPPDESEYGMNGGINNFEKRRA